MVSKLYLRFKIKFLGIACSETSQMEMMRLLWNTVLNDSKSGRREGKDSGEKFDKPGFTEHE